MPLCDWVTSVNIKKLLRLVGYITNTTPVHTIYYIFHFMFICVYLSTLFTSYFSLCVCVIVVVSMYWKLVTPKLIPCMRKQIANKALSDF